MILNFDCVRLVAEFALNDFQNCENVKAFIEAHDMDYKNINFEKNYIKKIHYFTRQIQCISSRVHKTLDAYESLHGDFMIRYADLLHYFDYKGVQYIFKYNKNNFVRGYNLDQRTNDFSNRMNNFIDLYLEYARSILNRDTHNLFRIKNI